MGEKRLKAEKILMLSVKIAIEPVWLFILQNISGWRMPLLQGSLPFFLF